MDTVEINRAPVLTLWATVVAQRLGFDRDEALTIGKAVAGQTAHRKGTKLGIYEPTPKSVDKYFQIKFGEALDDAVQAMQSLAASRDAEQLASDAFGMYIQFRLGYRSVSFARWRIFRSSRPVIRDGLPVSVIRYPPYRLVSK